MVGPSPAVLSRPHLLQNTIATLSLCSVSISLFVCSIEKPRSLARASHTARRHATRHQKSTLRRTQNRSRHTQQLVCQIHRAHGRRKNRLRTHHPSTQHSYTLHRTHPHTLAIPQNHLRTHIASHLENYTECTAHTHFFTPCKLHRIHPEKPTESTANTCFISP